MKDFDVNKYNFKLIFQTIKILTLLFCSIPICKYIISDFSGTYSVAYLSMNLLSYVGILAVIGLLWLFIGKDHNNFFLRILEIAVFFIICVSCIYFSGFLNSSYKFVFIFLIVIYTIENGVSYGYTLSFFSSAYIILTDLLVYNNIDNNPYFESDITLCAMFIVISLTLGYYVKIANSRISELSEYANIDGLTGVYNHRYFYQILEMICKQSLSKKSDLSLIMLDMDYFKLYNDLYGHQQGDVALKKIADLLVDFLPNESVICRYGGDEFAIILDNTNSDGAHVIAEKLRKYVSTQEFYGQERLPNSSFTVSMGIAQFNSVENDTPRNFVNRADVALYRAKYLRRNDVEVYTSVLEQYSVLDLENVEIQKTLNSLKALLNIINSRDSYTYNHTDRVVMLCNIIAERFELTEEERKKLCFAAYLHDIGKINISKDVLIKQEKLTQKEWEEIKRHPVESAAIISKIEGVEDIVPIVLQHHEKFNGTGYPNRLKGKEIHYLARLLTLADSFDAMTNARPYQKTKTFEEAFEEIRLNSGVQFDPDLTEKFIKVIKDNCDEKNYAS